MLNDLKIGDEILCSILENIYFLLFISFNFISEYVFHKMDESTWHLHKVN